MLVDPSGAAHGMWEPKSFQGFTVLNEPGAPSWFELMTRDYEGALSFYRTVYRWETDVVGRLGRVPLHDRSEPRR